MASKRRKKRALNTASRSRDQNSSLGLKSYGLIMGVIALAVIAVAAWAILGPERSRSAQSQLIEPAEISLDKSIGPEEAPVVVMEYGDFQCPYCQQFAAGPGRQLKQNYVDRGQVRFVYRHLAFIGAESLWAAEASECANEQGRFWDYHDKESCVNNLPISSLNSPGISVPNQYLRHLGGINTADTGNICGDMLNKNRIRHLRKQF